MPHVSAIAHPNHVVALPLRKVTLQGSALSTISLWLRFCFRTVEEICLQAKSWLRVEALARCIEGGSVVPQPIRFRLQLAVLDDREPAAERVADAAGALLHDMRQFVAEQLPALY